MQADPSDPQQLLAVGPFVAVLRRVAGRPAYSLFSYSCENCDSRLGRYTCEPLISPMGLQTALGAGGGSAASLAAPRRRYSGVEATAAVAAAAAGPVIDALRGVVGGGGSSPDSLPLPVTSDSLGGSASRDALRRSISQGMRDMRDALVGMTGGGGAASSSPAASSECAPAPSPAASSERPRQRLCDITQANVHVPQAAVDIRVLRVALPRVAAGDWSRAVWCPRNARGSGTGVSARPRPPSPHLGGTAVVGSRRPSFQLAPPAGAGVGASSSSLSLTAPAASGGGGGGASSGVLSHHHHRSAAGSAASNPGHVVASTSSLPDGRAGGGKEADGGYEAPQPQWGHSQSALYTGTLGGDAASQGHSASRQQLLLQQQPLGIGTRDRAATASGASLAAATPASTPTAAAGGGTGLTLPPRPPTPTGYLSLLPPSQYPGAPPIGRSVSAPESSNGGVGGPAAVMVRGPPLTPGGGVAPSFFRSSSDAPSDYSPHSSQQSTPCASTVYPAGSGPAHPHQHVLSLPGAVTAVQAFPPGMQQGAAAGGPVRGRLGSGFAPPGGTSSTAVLSEDGTVVTAAAPAGPTRSASGGVLSAAGGGRDSAGSAGSGASSSLSVTAAASFAATTAAATAASAASEGKASEGKSGCSPRSVAGGGARRHSRVGGGSSSGVGAGRGGERGGGESSDDDCMALESRQPQWSDELGSLTMKFLGQRIADSSSKNFLLELAEQQQQLTTGGSGGSPDARGGLVSTPCLQFGKIANGRFSCDWRFPLAPIQAFGIFLSAFQWLIRDADGSLAD